ncbi:MAG: ABC transporter permease [Phycisphaerae bacterium]|nr:ABC transporter permease [Phycisphaerae bacterium]
MFTAKKQSFLSLLLCLRYLQHRKIVLLSIAAVALSCALLIATDSLFTGFIETIESSVGKHLGDIILEVPSGSVMTEYGVLIESLESADCVQSATSVLRSQGLLLAAPGKVRPVVAWGVELQRRLNMTPLQESLLFQKEKPTEDISFEVPQDPDAVGGIVGIGVLAAPDEKTDLYNIEMIKEMLGRSMALTTGTVSSSGSQENSTDVNAATQRQFSRKVIKFKLVDVAVTGVYQFDESFVLLPIESLSQILYPDKGAVASTIHIRLKPGTDDKRAIAIIRGIWQNFAQERFDWYPFVSIESAKEMQKMQVVEYRKQMDVLLFIFGLISMGIIILVFCIFYLIVMTRRKDIGILKSCGLSSSSTAAIFVLFGTVVGFIGAVLGIGLGYVMIVNINPIERLMSVALGINLWKASTYMFTQIPNTMNWDSVLWVTAGGVIAAAVGSLIPAVAAARIRPVEILQYE